MFNLCAAISNCDAISAQKAQPTVLCSRHIIEELSREENRNFYLLRHDIYPGKIILHKGLFL